MFDSKDRQVKLSIRPVAVAGRFYPSDAAELDSSLNQLLSVNVASDQTPKAIIAPHAGYIYSGPIAASAYASLAGLRSSVKRVVLLGPAHRLYVDGMALPTNTHFTTPIGNVPLCTRVLAGLTKFPYVEHCDDAHRMEHSLEVHIPFLQKVFDGFSLIPILVGNTTPKQVATVLEQLWGGPETLIVVSSDLSHYHAYPDAQSLDAETSHFIENLDYHHINSDRACGCMPLRGLLKLAKEKNMTVKTLDLRNSGDTAGSSDSVVGYGAYALFENRILNADNKKTVFAVMKRSIEQGLKNGANFCPMADQYSAPLNKKYAVFVTLKLNGSLRGCIGETKANMPLIEAAAHYAHAAAFLDPRFLALTAEEYPDIEISLSILTQAKPIDFLDETDLTSKLRPDIDGLIIKKGGRRATFLPVVWETLPQPAMFLSELKRKAGIHSDETLDGAWRYTAEYYS